jgi:hypothetical protein
MQQIRGGVTEEINASKGYCSHPNREENVGSQAESLNAGIVQSNMASNILEEILILRGQRRQHAQAAAKTVKAFKTSKRYGLFLFSFQNPDQSPCGVQNQQGFHPTFKLEYDADGTEILKWSGIRRDDKAPVPATPAPRAVSIPKTGDGFNPMLIVILLLSAAGIAGTLIYRCGRILVACDRMNT